MSDWLLRAIPPDDYTFNGEMVYPTTTNFYIPYSFKRYIDSVSFNEKPRFNMKMNGFEYVLHQIDDKTAANIISEVTIQTVGSLPLWLSDRLLRLAYGSNGSGLFIEFYDDWVTEFVYTGRWINSGELTENSILHGVLNIRLACWSKVAIVA